MSITRAELIRATAIVLAMNTFWPTDIPPKTAALEEEQEEENGTDE